MPAHIPVEVMKEGNRVTRIDPALIPRPQQAIDDYRLNGSTITDPDIDFKDPLFDDPVKIDLRSQSFAKRFPFFDNIFIV